MICLSPTGRLSLKLLCCLLVWWRFLFDLMNYLTNMILDLSILLLSILVCF